MGFTRDSSVASNNVGGSYPTSGLYRVPAVGWTKARPGFNGKTNKPVGNGMKLLGVQIAPGFADYLLYNMTENDDGSDRTAELKAAPTKKEGQSKYDVFAGFLNTLLDSAGVGSTDEIVEGTELHVIWQRPAPGAKNADGTKVYGKTTVITAENYATLLASGFVAQDIAGVIQEAAPVQTERTEAPAKVARAQRPNV